MTIDPTKPMSTMNEPHNLELQGGHSLAMAPSAAVQSSSEQAIGGEPEAIYWRSLGELENSPEYLGAVEREFPEGIADAPDEVSRRGFLSAVAASVALAGLAGCRKPETHILPFNKRPEGFKPGLPQLYATTLSRRGYGIGVLAKSSDGRPTKIEGNPKHPSSLGGTDLQLHAELLQLYDPSRSRKARGPKKAAAEHEAHGAGGGHEHAAPVAEPDVWTEFYGWLDEASKELVNIRRGEGLHVLMPQTSSPSLLAAVEKMQKGSFPKARFHTWSALHADNELAGAKIAFGRVVGTHYDFGKADVVVSLDSDFLATDGNNLVNARGWAATRQKPVPGKKLSRLYVAESTYSTTGTAADHRFRTKSGDIPAVTFALANALGVGKGTGLAQALEKHPAAPFAKDGKPWIEVLARDLQSARGRSIVIAGPNQPAAVHAAVHAINQTLGNVGQTVTYRAVPEGLQASAVASIQELCTAIEQGKCDTLVFLGTNPVYDAPADLKFAELLKAKKPKTTIHVGAYDDETGMLCDWHFPEAHEFECWGDARAHDGTVSMRQPLVAPLHGGVSALEFLGFLNQESGWEDLVSARSTLFGYELVKAHWQTASGAPDFTTNWWPNALRDGFVAGSFAVENVAIDAPAIAEAVGGYKRPEGIEVVLRSCPKMGDGRYANNSWMQEIPDPLTKLSWDNAALVSMATARKLNVQNGDFLTITAGGSSLQIPAWILPGHADDSVTIRLGWGRSLPESCKVAHGTGFNGYVLRTTGSQWIATGAQVHRGQGSHELVCTQEHGTMAGRAHVREATVKKNEADPRWAPKMSPLDQAARLHDETAVEASLAKSLWVERFEARRSDPEVKKSPYQWGMVIDLNACTGCSACLAACVAENNVPMVGKMQVAKNREMFWIRADRYFTSVADTKAKKDVTHSDKLEMVEDPQVANMPVPCMQCENAPCESVCPVAATTHSPDGLNDMVYNRCIGTRYCSNNCPYKVRRFNYLDFTGSVADTKRLAFNPDVTVRSRGVMEKCTYCVQRINGGRIQAKLAGKKVGDGPNDVHVTTACAQACPTQAITFGNTLEKTSAVSTQRALDLNYGLLSELNTKPRTTYLGRVRNPNPELQPG
ncbi:MAG TPA: TAT-variant-translocated molybdopterin oxidoreductase [Planctomycetota bacterium]|nr:TAT-variant-translocated molybdopterin oxidoreductase [Planctomycetota bacterium]